MSNARTNLGFGDELDTFDPASWSEASPKPRPQALEKDTTRKAAEAAGFQSREPAKVVLESIQSQQERIRPDRRRRTGRNAQFNLKARPETIEAFCKIADQQGWGLGETLERAVSLLEGEYGADRS